MGTGSVTTTETDSTLHPLSPGSLLTAGSFTSSQVFPAQEQPSGPAAARAPCVASCGCHLRDPTMGVERWKEAGLGLDVKGLDQALSAGALVQAWGLGSGLRRTPCLSLTEKLLFLGHE